MKLKCVYAHEGKDFIHLRAVKPGGSAYGSGILDNSLLDILQII